MTAVARTSHDDNFAAVHEEFPLWTVQYHPEFTPAIRPEYAAVWEETALSFADATATRTLANFYRLAGGSLRTKRNHLVSGADGTTGRS